jgi:hypothetical protein
MVTLRACPATSLGLLFLISAADADSLAAGILVALVLEVVEEEKEEDGSADNVRERV